MIKNEREYRITKAQAAKFSEAVSRLSAGGRPMEANLRKLRRDALSGQLADLTTQLKEYEGLRSGARTVAKMASFGELPRILIQARIAAGLTQKQLAERLGLKEQQVQRYEATEYASASFERLKDVMSVLGVAVSDEVALPSPHLSLDRLLARLQEIGIDASFVAARLIPRRILAHLQSPSVPDSARTTLVSRAAEAVGRVLDIPFAEILGTGPLKLSPIVVAAGRFRMPARVDEKWLAAYTAYARSVAAVALAATKQPPTASLPETVGEFRDAIGARYGDLTFQSYLEYVWDVGIPVVPLDDAGAFRGASWRIDGRNVIVLKQRTQFVAHWLSLLLHELWHAGQERDATERVVVDVDDMLESRSLARQRRQLDPEEDEANAFMDEVVLGGRAEELTEMVVTIASGRLERFKTAVRRVANREGVPIGSLANYVAFRLSLQGQNWWGAATNLQVKTPNPLETCRSVFMQRADLARLPEADREFIIQALSPREEEHPDETD